MHFYLERVYGAEACFHLDGKKDQWKGKVRSTRGDAPARSAWFMPRESVGIKGTLLSQLSLH